MMTEHMRRAGLVSLALTVFFVGNAAAQGTVGPAALEAAGLYQVLTRQIAKGLDAQAKALARRKADLESARDDASGQRREELNRQIAEVAAQLREVKDQRTRAKGNRIAQDIFKGITTLHTKVQEIDARLRAQAQAGWGPNLVNLDIMAARRIYRAREAISGATRLATFTSELAALETTIRELDDVAPTPQTQEMVVNLTIALTGMRWIGRFCPTVAPFIEKNTEAGQALLEATARLGRRFLEGQSGLFVDGRPDGGRMAAFDAQFPDLFGERDMRDDIVPLAGVRDAYVFPGKGVIIWDPGAGRWLETDIGPDEILGRYAFLATYGNLDPTPGQVLSDRLDKMVGLRVKAVPQIIAPGETCGVYVRVERRDGSVVTYSGVELQAHTKNSALGALRQQIGGERAGQLRQTAPEATASSAAFMWTAPQEEHMIYEITASIPDFYEPVGPATCLVATGGKAEVQATADPRTVEAGGDGSIDYEIRNSDGELLKPLGSIVVTADGALEVEGPAGFSGGVAKGSTPYHAPKEPGDYVARVLFGGYIDAGFMWGENYMPAEAEVVVRVADEAPSFPDAANSIAGTYDGADRNFTWTMVLGGDLKSLEWSYTRWDHNKAVFSRMSGTATPTGTMHSGRTFVLEGEYEDELRPYRGTVRLLVMPKNIASWARELGSPPIGGVVFYQWGKDEPRPHDPWEARWNFKKRE